MQENWFSFTRRFFDYMGKYASAWNYNQKIPLWKCIEFGMSLKYKQKKKNISRYETVNLLKIRWYLRKDKQKIKANL